jgi:uncharacterized protein (TIGR02246 family)
VSVAYERARSSTAPAAEAAVAALYEAVISGWNAADAASFAAPFAGDGAVIGFDGSEQLGRDAVARELARIFADHRPARYVAKVRSIDLLSDDVALLRAVAGMIPPDGDELHPDRNAQQTLVAARSGERWQIVLFQNTPAQFHGRPDLAERLTEELKRVANSA